MRRRESGGRRPGEPAALFAALALGAAPTSRPRSLPVPARPGEETYDEEERGETDEG